ncbi:MAG: NAD-dependent malic enzyme, partial [Actinobacteria bacterium]|nr:NAD-dependent malic enzyme [Actinomycetota bacterium]
MADSTTAAFSIRLRVRLGNEPGALGHLATAIGSVGGNIWSLQGFEAKKESLDEELVVNCSSEAHQQQVLDAVKALPDIEL